MQLKCSRYVFSYNSSPEVVKDFIIRSANLAEQTFGRDQHFSRLSQVLEQARFLGWGLPRFSKLPEEFQDIPPAGVDHIFENQAKLLVDIAPIARVMLTNGQYCSVKMVCGSTAAGDLIWKCHLLINKDGCPYVVKKGKAYKVATKGTKIVCQNDTLAYDEKEVFEAFGGDKDGVWPMPFLPEFCIDRPIAALFGPEPGVVESVKIHETDPVIVLATEMVPWYRVLTADATKALTMEDREFDEEVHVARKEDKKLGKLVAGWDALDEEDPYSEVEETNLPKQEEDVEPAQYINIQIELSETETNYLTNYDTVLANSGISSREEAEKLKADSKQKARAEKWMLTAVNRARLLANASQKIGCLISLVQRHRDQQLLVVQPHQKWAEKLVHILNTKGFNAGFSKGDKHQLRAYHEGDLAILVTTTVTDNMLLEDIAVILMTSFSSPDWLDRVMPGTIIYGLGIKQLGYEDNNLITEHPQLDILDEFYTGPSVDVLRLDQPAAKEVRTPAANPEQTPVGPEIVENPSDGEPVAPPETGEESSEEKPKKKANKYRVKSEKGRPKMVPSYEKALEIAKRLESEGKKCEIYPPDSEEAVYITGIGELDK